MVENQVTSNPDLVDLLLDYTIVRAEVFNQLDPSIRVKLLAPGVEIIQNVYAGYDTEYQLNESTMLNDLLSSQLAVSTKTLLRFTDRSSAYELSTVSTLGSSVFLRRRRSHPIAYIRLTRELRTSINTIRFLKSGVNDEAIKILISGLKNKEYPYFTKTGSVVFSMGRTVIRP